MKINLLPQKYTPDGEISIETAEFIDDITMEIISQQRYKDDWCNIGTCNFQKHQIKSTKK